MCVVLTVVENNTSAVVWMVSYPLPSGESFSRVHGVFLTFVLVFESHFCHETGVLYEALVSMLRVCIDLRLVHFRGRAPDWRLRSSWAEQLPISAILLNALKL